MKQKGIVMETGSDFITVMTPEGSFVSLPADDLPPEIGTEITFDPPNRFVQTAKGWRWMKVALAAAILIMMLIPAVQTNHPVVVPQERVAAYYVSVDINPSIELGVDASEKVVKVETLNDEADLMLNESELIGMTTDAAIELIINRAAEDGYLQPDRENTIVFTITPVSPTEDRQAELDKLFHRVQGVLAKKELQAQISTAKMDPSIRQKAKEAGISTGKYLIWQKAQQAGLDVKLEDLKKSGVAKAIKAAGGHPGEIIGKAHRDEMPKQEVPNTTEKKLKKKDLTGQDAKHERQGLETEKTEKTRHEVDEKPAEKTEWKEPPGLNKAQMAEGVEDKTKKPKTNKGNKRGN